MATTGAEGTGPKGMEEPHQWPMFLREFKGLSKCQQWIVRVSVMGSNLLLLATLHSLTTISRSVAVTSLLFCDQQLVAELRYWCV